MIHTHYTASCAKLKIDFEVSKSLAPILKVFGFTIENCEFYITKFSHIFVHAKNIILESSKIAKILKPLVNKKQLYFKVMNFTPKTFANGINFKPFDYEMVCQKFGGDCNSLYMICGSYTNENNETASGVLLFLSQKSVAEKFANEMKKDVRFSNIVAIPNDML